ncbi:MAG TPA: response regulator, partial [Myxococcaceae bacterium]|nr:response regulator [Myxococcaceae bacterium]
MARILIIDDHDSLREGMAVVLKKSGIEVAAVRSGTEGLAAYKKSAFDMVVTDLKMDRMDGIEVVKQLRAHDPDCVVMVVTAFGTIETAVAAMQQGACDFITKPFAPEVLRAKVDQGLQIAGTRKQLQRLIAHNEVLSQQAATAV